MSASQNNRMDVMAAPAEEPAFETVEPASWTMPAVFNSAHSGRRYGQAFLAAARLSATALRRSEDFLVDNLFASAPEAGAPLLKAHFPRAYLDVNREPYELDPRMFAEALPGYCNTSSLRVAGGLGTIPRIVSEGEEIYRGPLSLAAAVARIDRLYRPYHRRLAELMQQGIDRFGAVLLADCHSMPSTAVTQLAAGAPDIVLGDRFGTACSEAVVALAEELFHAAGFSTLRNKPYAGGFIAQSYGAPRQGRHVLQIEINRALYMNERLLEPSAGYAQVAGAVADVTAGLARFLPEVILPLRAAAE